MDETINIKVQEEGSSSAASNIESVAKASDKAADSTELLMKIMKQVDSTMGRVGSSVDRLVGYLEKQNSATQRVVQAQEARVAATDAATKAVEQQAEAEKDAVARIQAVVAASLQQARAASELASQTSATASAQQGATAAAQNAAKASADAARSYTAAAGAAVKQAMEVEALEDALNGGVKTIDQWRQVEGQLVDAQQRGVITMQQFNRMVKQLDSQLPGLTASINKEQAAVNALVNKYDPLHAKMQQLEKDEATLKALRDKGVVSLQQYQRAMAGISGQKAVVSDGVDRSTKSLHDFSFASAGAAREYGVLIGELARGNWTRLEGSLLTLSNRLGVMEKLFSATGLAIGILTGTIAALAIMAFKGYEQQQDLNAAIIRTGGVSGDTAGQVALLSAQIAGTGKATSDTTELLTALVNTGRTTSDTFASVGRAASNAMKLTGDSVDAVATNFERLYDDPIRWAEDMDTKFHFLTQDVVDHAQKLVDMGDRYGAAEIVAKSFADNTSERVKKLTENMGYLEKAVRSVTNYLGTVKEFWGNLGKNPDDMQAFAAAKKTYEDWQAAVKRSKIDIYDPKNNDALQYGIKLWNQMKDARDKAVGSRAAAQAVEQYDRQRQSIRESSDAIDSINDKTQKQIALQTKLNKLRQDYQRLYLLDPNNKRLAGVSFDSSANPSGGSYASKVEELMQQANGKPKKGRAGSDESIKAWLEYNKQLTQLQETIDPTIAAMNKLEKAQDLLNEAVKRGDMDQGAADFALAQYQAQLSASLNPMQAFTDKLDDQIRALQSTGKAKDAEIQTETARRELLKQGIVLTDEQTAGILKQYQTIDALTAKQQIYQRIQKSIIDETKGYVDTLTVLNEMMAKKQITQQQADKYLANSNPELFANTQKQLEVQLQQYDEYYKQLDAMQQQGFISERDRQTAMANIRQQQMNAQLGQTMNFLGALSAMQNSQYSRAAKVGKAAAIAETIINTYKSATAAYSSMAGIPVVGPALGAAAAAAAIVSGMAQVQAIRSTNTAGFRTGGEFMVGGNGGTDSRRVSFDATPGEKVTINTPAQARALEKAGEQNTAQQGNVDITNVTDVKSLLPIIETSEGRTKIVNVIRLEASTINGILGRGA